METILYLFTGIAIGAVICYFIIKAIFRNTYIARKTYEEAEKTIADLRIVNATMLSKEELEKKYVARELFESITRSMEEARHQVDELTRENKDQQQIILRLTGESEQKISKKEIDQRYVPKDSWDILNRKLLDAERELSTREYSALEQATLVTELQEKEKHLNEKLTIFKDELASLHARTQEQFKNIATEILDDKRKLFVDENKREINNILDPLRSNLSEFKEKIEATRKEDIQDITSLKKEIEGLQKLNIQLSDDARNLATALKSEVKMQGNWGEDRLNMILEVEGLQKYIDFNREEHYRDDEQEKNRRPDFILKLPDNKSIIIDSKVSLTAYVNYFNAATAEEKLDYLKQHLRSVTDHINLLGDKNYQSLSGLNTPDYVFMFMPIESALTLAINQNPDIFNNALKKKIVLITPTTLVATLKVVKILWQKENQVKNVEEIFRQCGELYNKFVSFLEEMDKVESSLLSATKAHREAMNSLKDGTRKGNTIIGRFENIKKLEAKTNKDIPEKHLREIELLPDENEMLMITKDDEEEGGKV